MQKNYIALFTTAYPEGKQFLPDFFLSVSAQTDTKFDLWIGLDRIRETELNEFICDDYPVIFRERKSNESNTSFRQRALEEMIDKYNGIVFVDSDDILATSRVSSARSFLKHYDVSGCAMKIINEKGTDLGVSFNKPPNSCITSLLPWSNIFGMSNTCYLSKTLKLCLPFPTECVLLDWFVATRAWVHDACMYFDPVQRMSYRQHSSNTACVIPPFTQEQIIKSTNLVLKHYYYVLNYIPELPNSKRVSIERAQKYVEEFHNSITHSSSTFQEYTRWLNELPPHHIWWSCVANHDLELIWKDNR